MPDEQVVIVGAGPAGVAAAVQCLRLGIRPLLLDRLGTPGGLVANAFCVENYPGLEPLPGSLLAARLAAHLERFGLGVVPATVHAIRRATGGYALDTDRGLVTTRAVIVAAGTVPRRLQIPGASEAEAIRLFYEVRDLLASPLSAERGGIVVIGGGEAALDYSLSLARAGYMVSVLVRGQRFRAQGRLVARVRATPGIAVRLGVEPIEMLPVAGGIAVKTNDDASGPVCGLAVLAAVGRVSAVSSILADLRVDGNRGAPVSSDLRGLFVVGDARRGAVGQVGIAVGDGLTAAMDAAELLGSYGEV